MGIAIGISLTVRPVEVGVLCFEVSGVLAEMDVELGETIGIFDPAGVYRLLETFPTTDGDASRLLYNSTQIDAYVQPSVLARLRAEPRRLTLDKAINARQNAYYAKYGNAQAIIAQITQNYSPDSFQSKPQLLTTLSSLAQSQQEQLVTAYVNDGRTGVVSVTQSTLSSTTKTTGSTNESGSSVSQAIGATIPTGSLSPLPQGGSIPPGFGFVGDGGMTEDDQDSTSSSLSNSQALAAQTQYISNTDYTYRVPIIEAQAQDTRAQISLMDEQFATFMAYQNIPNLAQVYANELASIDSDVCRLQIDYLNTILLPSLSGVVTGVYKNPGEWVRAGEPVVRIENSVLIYVVATLRYEGVIAVNGTVNVTTQFLEMPGTPTTLSGTVVQARGGADDNQWEVILVCVNTDSSDNPIFPLGYVFAPDATSVTVV